MSTDYRPGNNINNVDKALEDIGYKTDEFNKAINNFVNKKDLAEQFIEIQPIYYERKNCFWVWDFKEYCWILKDETDILNLISENAYVNTINSKEKSEIMEALRQVGRINKPEEIKPSWVQFKNKIYDIETNESFDVSPKYFVANPLNWEIGESEETPMMDKLISSWVGVDNMDKLYEFIAFSIVPKLFIHSFHFLYAEPGTGKSTFVNLLIKFLGKNNCTATSLDRINNNVRFEAYNWHKKLLITLSEVSNVNDLKNSGLINQATGEDPLKGEIKGSGTFDFINYGKFIYPTNKLLKVSREDGFGRRVRVIKFINRFEKEKDVLEELPIIEFNNLAKKCLRIANKLWTTRQFIDDVSISKRIVDYQKISRTKLEIFLSENCDTEDFNSKILFDEFYSLYSKKMNLGESKISISRQLKKLGFTIKQENWQKSSGLWESGVRISGIKLRKSEGLDDYKKVE